MPKNTQKQLLAVWLLLAGFAGTAEQISVWEWNDNRIPPGVRFNRQFITTVASPERTPDGKPALGFKLISRPENGAIHSVPLLFCTSQKIVAGRRYRVSFAMRSSVPGKIAVQMLEGTAPWRDLGRSLRTFTLREEWHTVSIDCVAERNFDGEVYAPMIMLGKFPVDGILYLGPVRFESMLETLPLTLNPEWKLFVRPKLADGELSGLKNLPEQLGGVTGRTILPQQGMLEIPAPRSVKAEAVLLNEFIAPAAGQMRIGCGADYWFEFRINGELIYDTLSAGNGSSPCSSRDHIFYFPVKKGKNILAVRVLSGSNGWKFTCGEIPAGQAENQITEIVAGREWRPLNMDRIEKRRGRQRLDRLKVVAGSALDLSTQFPRFNIDQLGRLTADAAGKLTFENAPGKPVRLRGFNFIPENWGSRFYQMDHAELEELAEQIRLQGINLLRYHFLNSALCGKYGPPPAPRNRRKLPEVPLPSTPDTLPIDAAFLDRFDFFNKCCRERGIYLMVDILTDVNTGWTAATDPVPLRENLRYGIFLDIPGYRANFLAGFQFLLNRINPYTGKRMIDDPQYLGITFLNEHEHLFTDKGFEALSPAWRKFRNPTAPESVPALSRQLLETESPEGAAAREWLLDRIEETNRFFLSAATRAGYRGFVTQWDMFMRNLEGYARREMNAVSMHTYFAHPGWIQRSPATYNLPPRSGRKLPASLATVTRQSSITCRNGYLNRAAATRVLGKPFLLTEFSHNGYNRFSHEAGLLQGALAALQGWDALLPHANLVALYYEPFRAFSFDNASNPAAKVASLLTAFLWQRGDVAEAAHTVNFVIRPEKARSSELLGAIGSGCNALAFLTRISSNYNGENHPDAWNVDPVGFTGARSHGLYVDLEEETRAQEGVLRQLVAQLKSRNILPPGNRTDTTRGFFESETGEITIDTWNHTMSLITPRAEGAVCKNSRAVSLNVLNIAANSIPCTIAALSLDRRETLREAGRILVVVATQFAAEHSIWSDEEHFSAELERGGFQLLCRAGNFDFSLATTRKAPPTVYALNFNGTREKALPVRLENSRVFFSIDTSKFEYGTPFFEVVYP